MADNNKKYFAYCGFDKGFWGEIQYRLQTSFAQFDNVFLDAYSQSPEDHQKIFLKLIDFDAHIYYIDFSTNPETQSKIVTMIKRLNRMENRCVVALLDSVDKIPLAWASGADFYFVKGKEKYNLIHHPLDYTFPGVVSRPNFAVARLDKEFFIEEDLKVGYFGPDYIHLECNNKFEQGELVSLKLDFKSNMIPSQKYKIKNINKSNLYYDFEYAYDLDFIFLDPPEMDPEALEKCKALDDVMERDRAITALEEELEVRQKEYPNELAFVKKKYSSWLKDSTLSSSPKKTKVLIIDQMFEFMRKEAQPLDNYPYTIRCLDFISEDATEIDRMMPNIIAFNFNVLGETAEDSNDGQIEKLETIIRKVKELKELNPFVIVFNCNTFSSKALQDSFRYPLLMANNSEIDLDVIVKMAKMYEMKKEEKQTKAIEKKILELRKKDPKKYGRLKPSDLEEERFYVKKTSPLSIATISHAISFRTINEATLTFYSDKELNLQSYRLNEPMKFYLKIVPIDGKPFQREAGRFLYRALIHGVNAERIEEVRRFINATFLSKDTEMEEKDIANFKKLNEQVAQIREAKNQPEPTEPEQIQEDS
ncbi:hypothetical protein HBN50_08750 [Halobacteriovorax sp. GB3]|uniref:hypothetical protein n=1 Tax=Halobacteriovorax sp. GB3 TaxID=2719615 RepID=UPI0023631321|nr:hypothetical protein [Halobacteriovorax sp. GB3]MDD0853184.1 hypothetical protein [Halobacteriovorax sp. GB3]